MVRQGSRAGYQALFRFVTGRFRDQGSIERRAVREESHRSIQAAVTARHAGTSLDEVRKMKPRKMLSGLALLTFLCSCAAPAQRPEKIESVLDVIDREQSAQLSGANQCPPGAVPVCVSAFRHDTPVCSCGDPIDMQRLYDRAR